MAHFAGQLNWASLSGSAHLPWNHELFEYFQQNWFPALVAMHQAFEISSLSENQVEQLLLGMKDHQSRIPACPTLIS